MKTDGLIGHELFQFLRPDQMQIISDVAERISLKAGETVFKQGDEAEYFYIVLEGQVALRLPGRAKVSILIDEAGKGAVFGSCVCFQLGSYSLTAQCVEDTQILKIKAATLGLVSSTAPPWSTTMQQCRMVSGQVIILASSTCSMVMGPPNGCFSFEYIAALGLRVAQSRVTLATCAKSSGVVP